MMDSSLSAFEQLRINPSTDLWETELNRILCGERDRVLENLGDAANYIEDVLAQSVDRPSSRRAFLKALEDFLFQLSPDDMGPWIVDIVQHYTPRTGFLRLVEMLRRIHSVVTAPPIGALAFDGQDLRLRALHALERYYPIDPQDEFFTPQQSPSTWQHQRNFRDYVEILVDHLRYPRYAAYATRILISLNAITPADDRLLQVFSANLELLRILTRSSLMSGLLPEKILVIISSLVETLGDRARKIFSDSLSELGGEVRYYETGAIARLPSLEGEIFLSYKSTTALGESANIEDELEAYNRSDNSIEQFLATAGD